MATGDKDLHGEAGRIPVPGEKDGEDQMEMGRQEAAGHPAGAWGCRQQRKGELEVWNKDLENRDDPSSAHEVQSSIPALR